jgi:hypothetical protein
MTKQVMRRAKNIAIAVGVVIAGSLFACKQPKVAGLWRLCHKSGERVTCPRNIRTVQKELQCITDRGKSLVFATRNKIPEGADITDLKRSNLMTTEDGLKWKKLFKVKNPGKVRDVKVRGLMFGRSVFHANLESVGVHGQARTFYCEKGL